MAEVVYTKNAPDAIGPYSQAMKVGNLSRSRHIRFARTSQTFLKPQEHLSARL